MMFCMKCGHKSPKCLSTGGCGGRGGTYGCPNCDAVFVQTDGGMFSGGNAFAFEPYESYREQAYFHALRIRPHLVEWAESAHKGEWCWSEVGFGGSHFYPTEDEARSALTDYLDGLRKALPYPDCDQCGQKSEKKGSSWFECKLCKRSYFGRSWHANKEVGIDE